MTAPTSDRFSWCDDVGADRRDLVDALMRSVFDVPAAASVGSPAWTRFGCFEPDGRCIAGALFRRLTLALDEVGQEPSRRTIQAGALRMVAVAEDRRGRGLFRALMERILDAAGSLEPILLYAEEPALYWHFGFVPVAQCLFIGPAPGRAEAAPAQMLHRERDGELLRRLFAARTPVSRQVAVVDAADLALARVESDRSLALAYLRDVDALVVYEAAGDTLRLVDVAAPAMPSLAQILGGLPRRFAHVETLFPPDQLDWVGTPVVEDTGLMARGPLPHAMHRPFMLPPTTEF